MAHPTTPETLNAVFAAAGNDALIVDRSDLGLLHLTGETRLDLIDRMSTQAVKQLAPGEGAATVLTSDIGRIIDRLILYAGQDSARALTGENHADAIARYLLRFVFFNDDFQLEDVSAATAVFGVYGPRAGERLAAAGLDGAGLPRHHWRPLALAGQPVSLHRADPIGGDGYLVMAGATGKEQILARLVAAGIRLADAASFEALRIAAGVPRFGRELSIDYIPLETGLWDDVSFRKGCYTGQEIIARLESRGKLAKRLVRLAPAAPVEAGATIMADGRSAGTITSAAIGPDGPVALGYVRTAVLDSEAPLRVGETFLRLVDAEM